MSEQAATLPYKGGTYYGTEAQSDAQSSDADSTVDASAQVGVQNIEAITVIWSKTALSTAYGFIWLTYFVEGMLSATNVALSPFVLSTFAEHSLTPTVLILSSIIGGVSNFTIAKILDVFGRPQGFLICIIIATVGLVMQAACTTVEMFAAAQVFYAVGNNGLQYTLSVFVADTSSLHNRGLMQAFAYSPNMITCWIAGPLAAGFLAGTGGWQWAYGLFAILVPVITLPLFGLLQYHHILAKKRNVAPRVEHGRTLWQSVVYHIREFDAVGILLLSGGVALFLLPFNLYTIQGNGWSSPLIICLLVFGIVLLIAFVLWEKFFAPVTFIPYELLRNRTILGACFLSSTLFFSYFVWNSYFGSFLQVVNDLPVDKASYVQQIYTVGTVLASIGAGVVIRYTGRFKPITLYFAVPVSILGVGLMIYFRQPDGYIGYIVMCQILIAFSAGVIIICDEVAVLSTIAHQHIAVVLALLGLFGSIGGAIGLTVASAIWQAIFPAKLAEYLPVEELENLPLIYGDLVTQLSYEVGTPARIAIQRAYGDAQTDMLIAATAVWVLGFVAVLLWKDIKVTGIKQTKGHVV